MNYIVYLLQSGLGNLASYLAAHVLLCLLPAFFIAGALAALVPKEAVTRFLGRNAPKYVSYPAAALAGSVLAVCSCTIVPLFAGIYRKGAGLGPAMTFLFFAPAGNILALAYTGVAIGGDIAIARIILSVTFGIGIGLIMALVFTKDDAEHDRQTSETDVKATLHRKTWVFLLLLVVLLIAGTLKVGLLTNSYASVTLPISGIDRFQEFLYCLVPFDTGKGEEGVTAQGAILIGLLALIVLSAWRGLGKVDEGYNRWTWVSLALIGLTFTVASAGWVPHAGGLDIRFTGKMIGVALTMIAIAVVAGKYFEPHEIQEWLWETWRFVRQIFPLLIVGVFAVGIVRRLIQPEWIQTLAGTNTPLGAFAGVVFGVFMYFPTLVEVPIAKMFLQLGMHRGPLLAYLMADPELSLQSILITAKIIGKKKAWTYVGLVAIFSTLSGLIYGAWVDGASALVLLGYLAASLAALALILYWFERRNRQRVAVVEAVHLGE